MEDRVKKKKKVQKPGRSMLFRTVFLLAICGIAAFVVLAMKLYDIQIINNDMFEASALDAQLRQTTIRASRGTIFDKNGKILAMSASVENVFISPFEIDRDKQDIDLIADSLSEILGVTRESILEKSKRTTSQYEVIKSKVEVQVTDQVREFISKNKIRGIYLEPTAKRYYPNGNLASQVVGFVGSENTGRNGLEQSYDGYLAGVNGRMVRLKNAAGTDLLFTGYDDYYSAQDGYNITLTIDSSIQYFVEKHLKKAITDYKVQNGGMCIAMNAKTGAILAMANYPDYDPNDYQKLNDSEMEKLSLVEDKEEYKKALYNAQFLQWRNRALADSYEPGSVFKIITLAMALEENKANLDTVFDCRGYKEILGRKNPVRCWRRWGHGPQTLTQAMKNSCNMACVELGLSLGARTFLKYIEAFGFREKTGLDNSAEVRGLWWEDKVFLEKDNLSQLAPATFGQTFTVTPIQMITAAASAVNGGYLMQPYIVKQITDNEGIIVEATEPTVRRQVVSSETSATVRAILEDVVKTGTGKNAQIKGYRVGGKTGTSEDVVQIAIKDENAPKDYIVSFLGFAPADDPEIIILLLLDKPSRSTGIDISGGSMAAPAVGNMLSDILPLCLGITPEYTDEDLKDINIDMPRLKDRSVEESKELLLSLGFEVKIIGDGDRVTGQLPAPNVHIASGVTVKIYANEEIPQEPVIVPQLCGMTYSLAKKALENRGLFIRTIGVSKSDRNVVVSVQSIPAEQETPYGSVVEVTLIDKDIIERRN